MAILTDVDGWNHAALIAFVSAPVMPIGAARYVRSREQFDLAEIAIEVVDDWQQRGVGRSLLAELRTRAIGTGVRRVTWTVLEANCAVAALSRSLRECRRTRLGDGVARWFAAL
jgi:GNAT superfamily N-acetyltransferase